MPIGSVSTLAAVRLNGTRRINRTIAKIARCGCAARRSRRIEVSSGSMARARARAHFLSNDLTAYLVEEVVQFFPRYLGLHPAGIPRVELPRRLFISAPRGRDRVRRRVEEEDEEDAEQAAFPFVSSNVTSRARSLSFLWMLSKRVGRS